MDTGLAGESVHIRRLGRTAQTGRRGHAAPAAFLWVIHKKTSLAPRPCCAGAGAPKTALSPPKCRLLPTVFPGLLRAEADPGQYSCRCGAAHSQCAGDL